jgi:hypothetical protein
MAGEGGERITGTMNDGRRAEKKKRHCRREETGAEGDIHTHTHHHIQALNINTRKK